MITLIYEERTQYNVDIPDLTQEDIDDMTEDDIKELVDSTLGRRDYKGEILENEHHKNQYEILNEDDESIIYFEENYDL